MELFQTRLFLRIIFKSGEVYFLKVGTLAFAFACSTLILLFSISEFGYDHFHEDTKSLFRILQRNNKESYNGNRLSNRIPPNVFSILKSKENNLVTLSRLKLLKELNIYVDGKTFRDSEFYAADPDIANIFSFHILHGSIEEFQRNDRVAMLSSSTAIKYFGTNQAVGKTFKINTLSDTLIFSVGAVYADYPKNSHEAFNSFIHFDSLSITSLNFEPDDTGVYGKMFHSRPGYVDSLLHEVSQANEISYKFQSISEIYFGPRVVGDDAKHGDRYSIIILICITTLILFLALSSFINLTTLSLPYRSKELAVKKLAGTSQEILMLVFCKRIIYCGRLIVASGIIAINYYFRLGRTYSFHVPSLIVTRR